MSGAAVVVLGSLHLDVMIEAPTRPRLGETVVGSGWRLQPGGKGCNQAVAAALHGARVAMVGAVGEDAFAAPLLAHLRAHGVDVGAIRVRSEPSGMSVAITEPSGDYGAIIVSGANLALGPAVVSDAVGLISHARWLVLQNEVPNDANHAAAAVARDAGCGVILNAAPARALPDGLPGFVDILVVNALEAEALSDVTVTDTASAARAAANLLTMAACTIVTAGGDGVAAANRDGFALTLPAHPVNVVSTHGAGDVFVGALAARLADGSTLLDALGYANAAAALTVASSATQRAGLGPAAVMRLLGTAAA